MQLLQRMAQHDKWLDRLFTSIIQQKANKEEQSFFWQWIWKLDAREKQTELTKQELDAVKERLWGNISLETSPGIPVVKKWNWKRTIAAAAIITGVLFAGWIGMRQYFSPKTDQQYALATDKQSIKRFILPDSTEVTLNRNSTLQYSSAYNDKERRVVLTGEGYFEVHKDSLHPFIVQTDELETRALGTAFNIEARKNEGQIRIALTEGKVAISQTDNPALKNILHPGQLLRYDRNTKQSGTTSFTTDVRIWTNGGLVFNGIPLTEALDRLGERYGLQLQYERKQLEGKTVTASFGKTSWQNTLSSLLFAHDLQYTLKDSIIIVR